MVLNIELFREEKGGNPELVREHEKKRYRDGTSIDKVIECDKLWRKLRFQGDQLNRAKNAVSKAIGQVMKKDRTAGKVAAAEGDNDLVSGVLCAAMDNLNIIAEKHTTGSVPPLFAPAELEKLNIPQLKALSVLIDEDKEKAAVKATEAEKSREAALIGIGNLLHPNVPISNDEANNRVERTHGNIEVRNKYSHVDLVEMVDGYEGKRGSIAAGSRGYYLKGPLVFMQQAMLDLALHLLADKDFTPLYTPFFLTKEVMSEVAQLSQFDDELYKVSGGRAAPVAGDDSGEERYLIATSEQPIAAMHRDEWLTVESLPYKYAGVSTCFRLEAGSHGRDTRGIFRVHQFEKVEQFCITSPTESWPMLDLMVANAEKMYQSLELGYQVVAIVSKELNNAAAMKYDIEAWFPGSGTFRELASCTNCTDYQSRSLRVRYGQNAQDSATAGAGGKNASDPTTSSDFVHMLNATMCAATRCLCAVLETHQTETGVVVPEALRRFMPAKYREFIPFVKPPPKQEAPKA